MQNIHSLLHSRAAGVGTSSKRKLTSVLRGVAARGASGGHQGSPGPTHNRAPAHQTEGGLAADGTGKPARYSPQFHQGRVGRPAGDKLPMTGNLVAIYGSALRNGARVTKASMSAIALTMNRSVIGVPSHSKIGTSLAGRCRLSSSIGCAAARRG